MRTSDDESEELFSVDKLFSTIHALTDRSYLI